MQVPASSPPPTINYQINLPLERPVTAAEVMNAMIRSGTSIVHHHECGICGAWTRYERKNTVLYFDGSCGCSTGITSPRLSAWANAADWINSHTDLKERAQVLLNFGFGAPPALQAPPTLRHLQQWAAVATEVLVSHETIQEPGLVHIIKKICLKRYDWTPEHYDAVLRLAHEA